MPAELLLGILTNGDEPITAIPLGRYRHYKGNEYFVLGMATHSETLEEMVVYRPEYGARGLWVRPARMFLETVNVDGKEMPRFQRLDDTQATGSTNTGNLFAEIPSRLQEELIEALLNWPSLRIERIVSHGHASPPGFWYDQDQSEFVVLLQGAARLQFENETLEMTPGSFVDIAAHRRHRVESTDSQQPTVWLAIHYRD